MENKTPRVVSVDLDLDKDIKRIRNSNANTSVAPDGIDVVAAAPKARRRVSLKQQADRTSKQVKLGLDDTSFVKLPRVYTLRTSPSPTPAEQYRGTDLPSVRWS